MDEAARIARRKPWLAGVMSLLPGFGQLYNGQVTKAILFYVGAQGLGIVLLTVLLWSPFDPPLNVVIPALILISVHITFIVDAVTVARKHGGQYELKPFNTRYVYLAVGVLAMVASQLVSEGIRQHYVRAFYFPSKSMMPTLLAGDYVLVDMRIYREGNTPERGDVIVFKYPEDETKDFIKRVVGLPGDSIGIQNKDLLINGLSQNDRAYTQRVDPAIIDRAVNPRDNFGPITVPQRSYFVMGDNRDQSLDSRFWGFVKKGKIKGKAMMIYWSWDDKEVTIRWDRMGKMIQ